MRVKRDLDVFLSLWMGLVREALFLREGVEYVLRPGEQEALVELGRRVWRGEVEVWEVGRELVRVLPGRLDPGQLPGLMARVEGALWLPEGARWWEVWVEICGVAE